jgi:4-hydroxy-tetrahydrodipicolinate reductase
MAGVKDGIWDLGKNPFPGRIQNIHLIASCLGWKLDKADVKYEPVISKTRRETPWGFAIEPGTTAGCKQIGSGFVGEDEKIRIECFAIYSPDLEVDGIDVSNTVWIDGEPKHVMEVKGGIVERGSFVTSARLINVIPQVLRASPGLISPVDIPVALPVN